MTINHDSPTTSSNFLPWGDIPVSQEAIKENQAYLQVLAEMRHLTYRRNEKEIVSKFLNCVTEQFHFCKTWYGVYDKKSQTVHPSIHFGKQAGVIDGDSFSTDELKTEENRFPACTAVVSGNFCILNKLRTSRDFSKWQHIATEGDFNSLAVFPFEVNGQVEGVFVLYSQARLINGNVTEYLQFAIMELARILSDRRLWEEQKRLLRQAKEKAEMAVEMKSRFLANMSHEIRTPMTAILGYTEMLNDREITRQNTEEIARIIRNNSEYLLHILNDILDFSKIEAEMMRIEMSSFPLNNLLSEIDSIFSVVAKEKGVSLSFTNNTPYPAEIMSDPIRLKQIMLNLVGNAFKFTEKGKVEILVSWSGDNRLGIGQLRIDIKDTGKGISEDALEKIFNPFEQEDISATRKYEGTGLGLAISRRLVHLLSGNLTVESTPGQGSLFSIFLPQQISSSAAWSNTIQLGVLIDTNDESESICNKTQTTIQGSRILLVEDGIDNQRHFSMILKKAGAEVTIASNGQEGVDVIDKTIGEEQSFDLILMDMQMPVMDGLTAAKIIRSKGMQFPIVALTAHAMQEERDRCIAAGFTDFLTKPILRNSLLAAVSKILDTQAVQ